tara:strand:+ start:5659 stop:6234 length:576 start_codon:yes stop_codon:yes gene_type:complete
MPISVNGSGTVTGISVGGLPDGCVDTDTLATSVTRGKILQVVSATKTDTSSTTSATYADISGLSVAVTPASTSNKILVTCVVQHGGAENSFIPFKVLRGSTLLAPGTEGTGNMSNVSFGGFQVQDNAEYGTNTAVWQYLDSPSSTSALTYKIQWASIYQGYTVYINRPGNADNNGYNIFGSSTITVQEVAA